MSAVIVAGLLWVWEIGLQSGRLVSLIGGATQEQVDEPASRIVAQNGVLNFAAAQAPVFGCVPRTSGSTSPYVAVPRGKGARVAAVPLVPEGVAAARTFLDGRAFGPWPRSSVNQAIASATRRAG